MKYNVKILYIDDDSINVELFDIVFSEKFNVITGKSGMEGLELLNQNQDVDVIISDMKMPEMTGLEFIIKAKENFPDKKYFLLTGYGINQEIQKAIDSGIIVNCFIKPFDNELIEKKVLDSMNT